MDMKMGDFLPQTVIYAQLVVVPDAQFRGHDLGGIKAGLKHFWRCVLEIGVFRF